MSVRFVDIYPDEDQVRLAELAAAHEAAKRREPAPRMLHEGDPVRETAEAHNAFAEEAQARRIRVVMKHLPRKEWRVLMADHKPRPDEDDDKIFGVNMESLPDVLIPRVIDREQSENLPENVEAWLDSLSDVDYYDRLFMTAFAVNRGSAALADPTRRLPLEGSQTSSATSS